MTLKLLVLNLLRNSTYFHFSYFNNCDNYYFMKSINYNIA
nr:hypothetical protein Q903MT_gene2210 [Picea sitchensis]